MKKVAVLLANGFEEIEAITVIDVLRRAGVAVSTLGLSGKKVKGAHDLIVEADVAFEENQEVWDMVVLPGGQPGSNHLRDHSGVRELLRRHDQAGAFIAAICAAPIALSAAEVIHGRRVTCYPGFEKELNHAVVVNEDVVQDGKLITGRGPGLALKFSLHLVGQLVGEQKVRELEQGMLYQG